MNINELKITAQSVYDRIAQLDHEQFDPVSGRDTRNRSDIVDQAVTEHTGRNRPGLGGPVT
jgi:hypothetical protein